MSGRHRFQAAVERIRHLAEYQCVSRHLFLLLNPLHALNLWLQNAGSDESSMRTFSAVIERCPDTGLLVGYVPGFPGAHSQAESLDELQANLQEVIAMLLEDGEPQLEADFVGLQQICVPA